jgi:hypothetical protein
LDFGEYTPQVQSPWGRELITGGAMEPKVDVVTLKVVLSGRGDEIVDLAKTNLFR